jgi:hypothetical protein
VKERKKHIEAQPKQTIQTERLLMLITVFGRLLLLLLLSNAAPLNSTTAAAAASVYIYNGRDSAFRGV